MKTTFSRYVRVRSIIAEDKLLCQNLSGKKVAVRIHGNAFHDFPEEIVRIADELSKLEVDVATVKKVDIREIAFEVIVNNKDVIEAVQINNHAFANPRARKPEPMQNRSLTEMIEARAEYIDAEIIKTELLLKALKTERTQCQAALGAVKPPPPPPPPLPPQTDRSGQGCEDPSQGLMPVSAFKAELLETLKEGPISIRDFASKIGMAVAPCGKRIYRLKYQGLLRIENQMISPP
jgi:hypothetical protein